MNFSFLSKTELFKQIPKDDISDMLNRLGAYKKTYQKNEIVYRAGETVKSMGMVLFGSVNIESIDVWGNKSILDRVGMGQIFAETYACIGNKPLMVSVVSDSKTEILFLNPSNLFKDESVHKQSRTLIKNLLSISSQKNLALSRRILHTSPKTIRERLMSYFSERAAIAKDKSFEIEFNRQQLADYLSVDRSALSNELSKMKRDGLISFCKNRFILNSEEF